MKTTFTAILLIFMTLHNIQAQKSYTVKSPDNHVSITVLISDKIRYSVMHDADVIIAPSSISLTLSTGEQLGVNARLKDEKRRKVNEVIKAPFYKRTEIANQYNEMTLNFKDDYSIIFRAFNDGAAYRFVTAKKADFTVTQEEASFGFNDDYNSIVPYVASGPGATQDAQFKGSFENTYTHGKLSAIDAKRLAFLPLVVETANNKKVCITEADLEEYPGMYLVNPDGGRVLKGVFAPYPKKVEQGGHNQLQMLVKEREAYIAKAKGTRSFPWRVMIVATEDKQLADNDMVYKLATPSRLTDVSWIKPGKVAWDWWNDWNIYGVDFKAGINNDTYKYYIDFASRHKIEYVILDEGWAVNKKADLMQIIPEINIKELVDYGRTKNVNIILWAGYHAFDRDMENVCKHYAAMGVKGFKIDFMDRDDQEIVNFYYRAAETTARYKLLADFHGAYKPTGLQRTYPNVLNFEGVHGLENFKWIKPEVDMVKYDVTIPFIRMIAGPLDYTQGAMNNATKGNYRTVYSEPMSQGTRAHQVAEYVVFESPLSMLADNPSNYLREEETVKFISAIPNVWDNTVSMDGKIGEYVAIARKKGNDWYIGVLTNWDARVLTLDLSFLGAGNYKIEAFRDGVNADRAARDYKYETGDLGEPRKLTVTLAPGGGFAARIYKP